MKCLKVKSRRFAILFTVFLGLMSACSKGTDMDGVPIVDIHGAIVTTTDQKAIDSAKKWGLSVPSKRMILVMGKQMDLQEFLLTYCQGKIQNETCIRGAKIHSIDSSSGPVEVLPAGL